MKFTRESHAANTVQKISPGSVVIGGETYDSNIALLADRIIDNWSVPSIEDIGEDDLSPLLEAEPEILIIGGGWSPSLPPRDLMFTMARLGIGLEVMDTPAACRTFNILISEDRLPAAILYLDSKT